MTNTPAPLHFPVRLVVQRTGLSADVLRAWERRYGAVVPHRTAGGQRVYSDADIERLRLLARLVAGGHAIGQIARASDDELQRIAERDVRLAAPLPDAASIATDNGDSLMAAALDATDRMEPEALERLLRGAALRLGADEMIEQVLAPLLFTIGSLWHQGVLRPAQEHVATAVIRGTLSWMMELATPTPNAPCIVVGTPAGQHHEMGAMIAAAVIAGHGNRVLYLGADLPAQDIAAAALQSRASAVALSVVYPYDDPKLAGELMALRAALPSHVGIITGGAAAPGYAEAWHPAAITVARSLDDLRDYIRGLPSNS
jgi:DNA-binding transcriptional MerR regulator/methylmalonyl-CoA mutase cobalamin-binding subunit